jgi:hypothetical protein
MIRPGSLFSQLIHEVPRSRFDKCVAKHDGEKHAKGFTCWNQFVAMEFCHLERADSLREICNGLLYRPHVPEGKRSQYESTSGSETD